MQLPLPIHQIDDDTFDNFYAENSLMLLDSLRQNFESVHQPFFYIWGGKSSGKSHLLKAVCNHYLQHNRLASYIPLEKLNYFSPAVLDNADQLDVVCIDDLHHILGHTEWENAIFNLFNRLSEQQSLLYQGKRTLLLMSADVPANQLNTHLPDLASRLIWGEVYHLADLNDDQKRVVLQRNARNKGLELTDEVANFLLKRLDRDLHALTQTLDELDKASLQAQRKLTVPFVKSVLGL